MRLLLIRHGQIPSNVLGQLESSKPGPDLTALGRAQAASVPAALAGTRVDSVFVSTLVRTQQTAAPFCQARGLPAHIDENLREIQAGSLEGRSDREAQLLYVATAFAWAAGDLGRRMPDGQDGNDFFRRFDAGIDLVTRTSPNSGVAAVFSHGMAIRTWVSSRAVNIDAAFGAAHELDNTGMVVLDNSGAGTDGDGAHPDGADPDDASAAPARGWQMLEWHSAPIGGPVLADPNAVDPTGETVVDGRTAPTVG